jgi:hypothetical protein
VLQQHLAAPRRRTGLGTAIKTFEHIDKEASTPKATLKLCAAESICLRRKATAKSQALGRHIAARSILPPCKRFLKCSRSIFLAAAL